MSTKSLFSRIIKYVIVLAILMLTGIIIAVNVIDPNNYKSDINKIVSKIMDRKFEINGNIQWSIFPDLSLSLQDTKLENKEFFKGDFIFAKEVQIKLEVLPLLKKKVVVKGLALQGIEINLERDKFGKTNIDDLLSNFDININDLSNQKNKSVSNNNNNDNASNNSTKPTSKTATSSDSNLISNSKSKSKSKSKSESKANTTSKNSNLKETDTKISTPKINIKDLEIKNSKLVWQDKKQNKHIKLTNFNLKARNFNLTSKKELPPIKVNGNLTDLINFPQQTLSFNSTIYTNMDKEYINIQPLELQFENIKAKTNIKIENFMHTLKFNGKLEILPFSPQKLIQSLKIKKDANTEKLLPKEIKVKSNVFFENHNFGLDSIFIDIDKGKLTGNLDFAFKNNPTVNFNLNSDKININELGIFFFALNKTLPQNKKSTNQSSGQINDKLSVKGSFDATNIQIDKNLKLDKLNFKVDGKDGIFKFAPMKVVLLNTTHNLTLKLNLKQQKPQFELTEKANNFAIEKLLKLVNDKPKISGNTNFQANLAMNGTSVNEFKKTVSGNGKIKITNGFIHGIDVPKTLAKAQEGINNLYNTLKSDGKLILGNLINQNLNKYEVTQNPTDKTAFTSLSASFTIKNGIVHNNDLNVRNHVFTLTGNGTINLVNNTINYNAQAKLNPDAIKQETKIDKIIGKYPIDILISGDLNNPKITPQIKNYLNAALKDAQKSAIRRYTEKAINKIIGNDKEGVNIDINEDSSKDKIKKLINIFK